MLVFAHLGILLGAMLDFGPRGLIILTSLCSSFSSLNPELLWSILRIAPWTFVGMLVGSNLGMLLSSRMLDSGRGSTVSNVFMYPVCNLGMLAGMLLTEMLIPVTSFAVDTPAAGVVMLLLMLLGMSIGMLLSWWILWSLSRLPASQRYISQGATP